MAVPSPSGHFGVTLGRLWPPRGPFERSLGALWALLAALGPLLGALGPLLAALGALSGALGAFWDVPRPSRVDFGAIVGSIFALFLRFF